MVVGFGLDGDRVVPGRGGLVVAEPGPGGGLVEICHRLPVQDYRQQQYARCRAHQCDAKEKLEIAHASALGNVIAKSRQAESGREQRQQPGSHGKRKCRQMLVTRAGIDRQQGCAANSRQQVYPDVHQVILVIS